MMTIVLLTYMRLVKDTISDSEPEDETNPRPKPSSSPFTRQKSTTATKPKKATQPENEDGGEANKTTAADLKDPTSSISTLVAPKAERKDEDDAVRDVSILVTDIFSYFIQSESELLVLIDEPPKKQRKTKTSKKVSILP